MHACRFDAFDIRLSSVLRIRRACSAIEAKSANVFGMEIRCAPLPSYVPARPRSIETKDGGKTFSKRSSSHHSGQPASQRASELQSSVIMEMKFAFA